MSLSRVVLCVSAANHERVSPDAVLAELAALGDVVERDGQMTVAGDCAARVLDTAPLLRGRVTDDTRLAILPGAVPSVWGDEDSCHTDTAAKATTGSSADAVDFDRVVLFNRDTLPAVAGFLAAGDAEEYEAVLEAALQVMRASPRQGIAMDGGLSDALGLGPGDAIRLSERAWEVPVFVDKVAQQHQAAVVGLSVAATATSGRPPPFGVAVLPADAYHHVAGWALGSPDGEALESLPVTMAIDVDLGVFVPMLPEDVQKASSPSATASKVAFSCVSELDAQAPIEPERALRTWLQAQGRVAVARDMVLYATSADLASAAAEPAAVERSIDELRHQCLVSGRCADTFQHVFRVESVVGGSVADVERTEITLVPASPAKLCATGQCPASLPVTAAAVAASAQPAFAALVRAVDGSRVVEGVAPQMDSTTLAVVHGSSANGAGSLVRAAVRCAGAVAFELDTRLVDAVTALTFAQSISRTRGAVLVLRHCDALDTNSELGRAVVAAAAGEAWAVAEMLHPEGDDGSPAVGQLFVIAVFEANDPPPASFTSVASWPTFTVGTPTDDVRTATVAAALSVLTHGSSVAVSRTVTAPSLASWAVGLGVTDIVGWLVQAFQRKAAEHPTVPAGVVVSRDDVDDATGTDVCAYDSEVPARDACVVLEPHDLDAAIKAFQQQHGHNLTSTKLQPVKWDDVGGLEDAKREIMETIELPLKHPELFRKGAKQRAGVLMYGPPGCGKTLLAKAVATEMGLNFISVKGPELINPYVGESERNIRELFQRARDNSPCIAFFDELDALAPRRGAKGDSGGVMDRIVAQLLAEVDGIGSTRSDGSAAGQVFIVGATNRPDLLDPSLMRPGRFDRPCYLGPPGTPAEQLAYIRALTRKFDLASDVRLEDLVATLPPSVYTGADYFALCSDAMMLAVDERVDAINAAIEQDGAVPPELEANKLRIEMRHFSRARDNLTPSVSAKDLHRYERLRDQFAATGSVE